CESGGVRPCRRRGRAGDSSAAGRAGHVRSAEEPRTGGGQAPCPLSRAVRGHPRLSGGEEGRTLGVLTAAARHGIRATRLASSARHASRRTARRTGGDRAKGRAYSVDASSGPCDLLPFVRRRRFGGGGSAAVVR